MAVGFAISFALGVWSPPAGGRSTRRSTAIAGILFTIPSLALFAALVPITGLSVLTAEVPLVALHAGDPPAQHRGRLRGGRRADVLEAADGMGYTRRRRLWSVELPLAVPLMIAGLRIATVSTIGLVTITAILGDALGGLGFFIFEGMNR